MPACTDIYLDCPLHFVLKRAFRAGSVSRPDLVSAFGLSPASATRVMARAPLVYPLWLRRKGHELVPTQGSQPPREADEESFIRYLDAKKLAFSQIGLTDAELSVAYPQLTSPLPRTPGVLHLLLRASVKERPIDIRYVGLRKAENAAWRTVLPVGFERMGDQWRMLGRDLLKPEFPLRVYVLARILEAADSDLKLPRKCPRHPPVDNVTQVRVLLNPALTMDQQAAVANELGLSAAATVRLPARAVYEFQRKVVGDSANPEVAWPLAIDVSEVK